MGLVSWQTLVSDREAPMGMLVNGVEYGPDGEIKGFPSYYLETDDKVEAFAEAMRRGTSKVTLLPVASRPSCYDPVTGRLVITRWIRLQIWLEDFSLTLRLVGYALLFVGVTAAFIYALVYFGLDPQSPSERRRHEQQIREIQRGR